MKYSITYFFRAKNVDFSIEKVFSSVISNLETNFETKIFNVEYNRVNFISICKNIIDCHRNKNQINHITGVINYCVFGLPYSTTIITIHDLISIERGKGFKKYFFWLFFFYLPLKRVKYVTCISDSVRDSLVKFRCCNKSKIIVIPNPVSDNFIFQKKIFNSECPRILHVGTRAHKNLERVIKSLENINCLLVIIGSLTNQQKMLLKISDIRYLNFVSLSDGEIYNEYVKCDIVSFPSLYEGFGVPIIEAQAVGRVVLTSNIAPMNSVAGDDYFFINPYDIQSIQDGFLNLINNHDFRENLVTYGLTNAERFRSKNVTRMYHDLYKKVLCEI